MCSRCYRLVTATTKATSRASIATAVSTGTSFLDQPTGDQAKDDLLNDRPGRLTEPDRVFDSCSPMLGDELTEPWERPTPERLISAGRFAVSSTRRRCHIVRFRRSGGVWRLSWPCCLECHRPLSAMMRSDARWCSPRCRQRAYRRSTRQSRPNTSCRFCGEWLPRSKRSDARYCSSACRGKAWTSRYEDDLERLQRELVSDPEDRRLKLEQMWRIFHALSRTSRARRSVDQVVRVVFLNPWLQHPHPRVQAAAWDLWFPHLRTAEDREHAGSKQGTTPGDTGRRNHGEAAPATPSRRPPLPL
jgi:hypothetical protein